ncbi:Dot1p [Malassezia vespertilionis]|uniref:Histone-lysine N-methyltransferase, H3 lysine-79 specific n=1 Tax=Malassezia vespertilionis TaxID=2020962 RepID=A0A2N1JGB2_9BASI|nr:Dot1p [Malassezia vespertilionis]
MDFFGAKKSGGKKAGGAGSAPRVTTTTQVKRTLSRKPPRPSAPEKHNALSEKIQKRIALDRHEADMRAREKQYRAAADTHAQEDLCSVQLAPPTKRVRTLPGAHSDDEKPNTTRAARSDYHIPRNIVPLQGYEPLRGEQAQRAINEPLITSRALVLASKVPYYPFFEGLEEPGVTLSYPARGAKESFLLLVSHDKDEYDPVLDLLRSVRVIVAHFVPPAYQAQFGDLGSLEISAHTGVPLHEVRARGSVRGSSVVSTSGSGSSTPLAESLDTDPILRSFTKARNRRHGPLFVRTVERFNETLERLKAQDVIEKHLEALGASYGLPELVWRTVQEQVYARAAAPHVEKLKQYEAFSDNVYGEMLPPFLSEVCQLAQLKPTSVFVDLGSGIGNLVLQASLQIGCEAYGYAFRPQTNETLSLLFLDLRDGAIIVSLRSFVPHDFRLTERTLSSPAAILRVEERRYTSGSARATTT